MTRADKWKKRPAVVAYWDYCNKLKECYTDEFPECVGLVFFIKMPDSWSKKKKSEMNHKPHQSRPDVDNFIKGVFDALCEEDSYIWVVTARKYWSYTGGLEIYRER